MTEICYLCGKPIVADATGDHVVPKQLLKRIQPKVKGFDYAGVLPSHAACNNEFGSERVCQQALTLIRVLHDEDCSSELQNPNDPKTPILVIISDCIRGFTKHDRAFFKLYDVQGKVPADFYNPSFLQDMPKTNPLQQSLYIALAVLTKSAAALLVDRCYLKAIPIQWCVVAVPYFDKNNAVDFDELMGDTKPFDDGLKTWVRAVGKGDWFVIYKVRDFVLYLLFLFSGDRNRINEIARNYSDADCLLFEGTKLMDLVGYQWRKIEPQSAAEL